MHKGYKIALAILGMSAAAPAFAQNHAPVATTDYMSVSACNFNRVNVVNNDTDADGDTLTVTGFSGGGSWGWWNPGAYNDLEYWAWWYPGTDVLTYTVEDGHGGSAQGTLYVNVTEANPGDC